MAVPLQDLLKKDKSKYDWGPLQDAAVQQIKEAFISQALLKHYDSNLRNILQTDASDYAMGAVKGQVEEG